MPGWYHSWGILFILMSCKDEKNVSCHYWLLHIDFKYFGFQTLGENMVYNQQCYMNR